MKHDAATQPANATSRPHWGRIVVWTIVGLALLFIGLGLAGRFTTQPQPGDAAPDFTLTTYDGEVYILSELRGQVAVVNFWASWCVSCGEEADDLERAWQQYRELGVIFLGVNYSESETGALAYLEHYEVTYPNGPDPRTRISDAYHIQSVPETFVVGRDGVITFFAGWPVTFQELSIEIEAALAGG